MPWYDFYLFFIGSTQQLNCFHIGPFFLFPFSSLVASSDAAAADEDGQEGDT